MPMCDWSSDVCSSDLVTVNTTACYRHLLLRVPTTIACYCHRNHTPPPATTTLPVITATAPATCCYCYCCYDSYYCYYLLFPTASLYDDCHCRRHNHSHLLGCSTHTHMRARALYPSSLLSKILFYCTSDQIRSVAQSCPTLCDPMNRSTPGLPVHHQLPGFTETHVH